MKSKTVVLSILLTLPVLVACGNEKNLTGNTQSGVKVAGSPTQKPIVYAKTKKQLSLEKKLAKANAENPMVQQAPVVATPVVKAPFTLKVETLKPSVADSVTVKPKDIIPIIKPDTLAAKPIFSVVWGSSYLRKPTNLKKFSVVVGSFSTVEKTADVIKIVQKAGLKPVIVPNEKGAYRVIASTYDIRDNADIDALGLELDGVKCWIWIK